MTTLPDFSPNRPKTKYITYRQESKDKFQFFFQPPRTPRAPRKKSKILKLTGFLLTSVTVTNYGAVPTLSERIVDW